MEEKYEKRDSNLGESKFNTGRGSGVFQHRSEQTQGTDEQPKLHLCSLGRNEKTDQKAAV